MSTTAVVAPKEGTAVRHATGEEINESEFLNRPTRLVLTDRRVLEGTLVAYDGRGNLMLQATTEICEHPPATPDGEPVIERREQPLLSVPAHAIASFSQKPLKPVPLPPQDFVLRGHQLPLPAKQQEQQHQNGAATTKESSDAAAVSPVAADASAAEGRPRTGKKGKK